MLGREADKHLDIKQVEELQMFILLRVEAHGDAGIDPLLTARRVRRSTRQNAWHVPAAE